MTLNEGDQAPAFSLPADNGQTVSLTDYNGKKVVLYFYPKDDTPGCTKQEIKEFEDAGAVVIGMSPDKAAKHDKFIAKHNLAITLAANEEKDILEAYGVWVGVK